MSNVTSRQINGKVLVCGHKKYQDILYIKEETEKIGF